MKTQPLTFYLPDERGIALSPFGKGNQKIGSSVFTYSRLPGHPSRPALGSDGHALHGTCPGASAECEAICYAARVVRERDLVYGVWAVNSFEGGVPPLPAECRLLRFHISGDFDEVAYIRSWVERLTERPDVTAWGYTRSWRVPHLLPELERLRALSNVELFASIDQSVPELPPTGWRRAWIDGDARGDCDPAWAHEHLRVAYDNTISYVCPEQTGRRTDCASCRYCFDGRRGDVTFLRH